MNLRLERKPDPANAHMHKHWVCMLLAEMFSLAVKHMVHDINQSFDTMKPSAGKNTQEMKIVT